MAIPTINYTKEGDQISNGVDSIAIVKMLTDIPAGRALDVSDWNNDIIPVLTPIITDAQGTYKPLAAGDSAYSVPSSWKCIGLAAASVKKSKPICPIITSGAVLAKVRPNATKTWTAIENSLPLIQFMTEEAGNPVSNV